MKFFALISSLLLGALSLKAQEKPLKCDVLVYGGTPAGVAAACAAAEQGRSVILVEPFSFVGGLVTNGLSHADFRSLECHSGFWWDFNQRVVKHYEAAYGKDSEQVKASFHGNFGEPKVNRAVFEEMLAERKNVQVLMKHELSLVASTRMMPSSIISISVKGNGAEKSIQARVFIDASYEGDLMAEAGVRFTVGREDQAAYGESIAENVPKGGDVEVQGYNFRWCMTQVAQNKLPAPKPEGYNREEFVPVLELYKNGKLTHAFGEQGAKAIYKVQPPLLPNGKTDINDMSHGVVRLSMPDINNAYPTANVLERKKIVQQHLSYQLGLLYFLQNDSDVPANVREDALSWGFCKDEWPENNHLPEQLYVREARRMIGQHVFTQNDTTRTLEDVRSPLQLDSIAIGDYTHNCHGTGRVGTRFDGRHTGEFYKRNAPFQVAYGTIVPKEVSNLLVPVAASSSHVGFGALRLEPIWAQMGQAAGFAAAQACEMEKPDVQNVNVPKLQNVLHQNRAATVYFADIAPDSPDFAAVQWLATLGGWHGLHKSESEKKPDWKKTFGQYAEAFPLHEAGLNLPMDEALLTRWQTLLPEASREKVAILNVKADGKVTRGDVLRAWYKAL